MTDQQSELRGIVAQTALELSQIGSFDTHELIRQVMQRHQRVYVEALASTTAEPLFQTLHSMIGTWIGKDCADRLDGEASRSADVFGQNSNCIRWKQKI